MRMCLAKQRDGGAEEHIRGKELFTRAWYKNGSLYSRGCAGRRSGKAQRRGVN